MTLVLILAAFGSGEFECPPGAEAKKRSTAEATERWCDLAGKRHGPRAAWYADGARWFIGSYEHGKRSGRWQFWYNNGKPQSDGSYAEDLRHGASQHWFESGELSMRGRCHQGKEDGPWFKNYPNGKPELQVTFRGGKAGARQFFSRRGHRVELRDFVKEKMRGGRPGQARFDAALKRYSDGLLFDECAQ